MISYYVYFLENKKKCSFYLSVYAANLSSAKEEALRKLRKYIHNPDSFKVDYVEQYSCDNGKFSIVETFRS